MSNVMSHDVMFYCTLCTVQKNKVNTLIEMHISDC